MINMMDVYEFCTTLRRKYNIGLREVPFYKGKKFVGEYYTKSGQLLSIGIMAYPSKAEVKIYDAAKRLVFNSQTTQSLCASTRIVSFIEQSFYKF